MDVTNTLAQKCRVLVDACVELQDKCNSKLDTNTVKLAKLILDEPSKVPADKLYVVTIKAKIVEFVNECINELPNLGKPRILSEIAEVKNCILEFSNEFKNRQKDKSEVYKLMYELNVENVYREIDELESILIN